MSEPSALSLIPLAVVLLLAITLRRPILALVCGAASGLLLLSLQNALSGFAEISLKVMQDETIGWLILVCGSFGALIALLVRTGGRAGFRARGGQGCARAALFPVDDVRAGRGDFRR